ncbi:hypothetical protein [Alkalicoccobacillus murimartini]|uniref:Lipoprotein n=1 Tax=Alkalicoccobacillus murimartini TaxID=171685 RepID=A0ABT9YG12_9BACI|nr:hypothetical protein [Alkalicoccobacillus murimartini]MDQ0206797.1 hypothetical protein [Alkalicoccobacillus murimartini]
MKYSLLLAVLSSVLLLTACGQQPLTIRSTLEGDQYVRNNIESFTGETFNQLLSAEYPVDELDIEKLKNVISENEQTRYTRYNDELYRYNAAGNLLYYTKWSEEAGEYKLTALEFPE